MTNWACPYRGLQSPLKVLCLHCCSRCCRTTNKRDYNQLLFSQHGDRKLKSHLQFGTFAIWFSTSAASFCDTPTRSHQVEWQIFKSGRPIYLQPSRVHWGLNPPSRAAARLRNVTPYQRELFICQKKRIMQCQRREKNQQTGRQRDEVELRESTRGSSEWLTADLPTKTIGSKAWSGLVVSPAFIRPRERRDSCKEDLTYSTQWELPAASVMPNTWDNDDDNYTAPICVRLSPILCVFRTSDA